MYEFKFKEIEPLELKIENKLYQIDIDDEDILLAVDEFLKSVEEAKDAPENAETVFKIIEIYKNLIDDILGAEAVGEIFEGRTISAKGLEQVCRFILNSITEHRLPTPAAPLEFPEPVKVNREQRRTEARRKR